MFTQKWENLAEKNFLLRKNFFRELNYAQKYQQVFLHRKHFPSKAWWNYCWNIWHLVFVWDTLGTIVFFSRLFLLFVSLLKFSFWWKCNKLAEALSDCPRVSEKWKREVNNYEGKGIWTERNVKKCIYFSTFLEFLIAAGKWSFIIFLLNSRL